jgi:hypothetical protein
MQYRFVINPANVFAVCALLAVWRIAMADPTTCPINCLQQQIALNSARNDLAVADINVGKATLLVNQAQAALTAQINLVNADLTAVQAAQFALARAMMGGNPAFILLRIADLNALNAQLSFDQSPLNQLNSDVTSAQKVLIAAKATQTTAQTAYDAAQQALAKCENGG